MTAPKSEMSSTSIDILPDELILQIFRYLPLESIVVCEEVSERWRYLARDEVLWRRIVVVYSGKPGVTDTNRNLELITKHQEHISCLKIQYVYSYPTIKTILQQCGKIISIELVMCRISSDFVDDIRRWTRLKKLNLKNSILLQNNQDFQIQFDMFEDLNYLSLSEFGLSDSNCNTLLRCRHLCHIYIDKIKNLNLQFIKELTLSKMHVLKSFHFHGGDAVDDHCIELLAKCPKLKDLAIVRCESLTDEGLAHFANLQSIVHLQVWNNVRFSESNLLKTLSSPKLITLQSLSLSRIGNISPIIVDVISEYYKNLRFLALYQCPRIINTDYEKQLKSKFRNIEVVLY